MKWVAAILVFVAKLLSGAEEPMHTTEPIAAVKKAVEEKKAVLVDVREKSEWDEAHLKDAIFAPLSGLNADPKLSPEVPKDKPIYLHCVAGVRALKAAEILKAQGYDARALKMGYAELLKNGFEPAPKKE